MLHIVTYQQSSNIYDLNFLSEQNELVVIAPKPSLADRYRSFISQDVITISSFLKKEHEFFFETESKIKRKSELMLIFASLWKKFFNDHNYEYFNRAFNLLTDLRSFSLDMTLYESILEEYEPVFKKSTLMFNQLLENLEEDDEHSAYAKMAHKLREVSLDDYHENKRNILFHGFQFITAQQVDFLKSLAIRDDIYITVPSLVYQNLRHSDWIYWLQDIQHQIINLGVENNSKELSYIQFPAGTLSEFLQSKEDRQLLIPSINFDYNQVNEVPNQVFFKSSVDLFSENWHLLKKQCELDLFYKDTVHISDFDSYLENKIKTSFEKEDFLSLRLLIELKNKVNYWGDLSSDNETLDERDLRVVFDVLKLDLPRNFAIPLTEQSAELANLENFKDIPTAICLTSENAKLRSSINTYPEQVEEYLATIGPIKKMELDLDYKIHQLREVLNSDCLLYVEQGLLNHSEDWAQVLSTYELKEVKNTLVSKTKSPIDPWGTSGKTDSTQKFSATRLQTFIECKRKYYYQYIEKNLPDVVLESQLQPNQLGELEHKVVEIYCKKYDSYDEKQHKGITEWAIKNFQEKHDLNLNESYRENYFIEIVNYSRNAIEFMLELKKFNIKFEYEKKITKTGYTGSIDAYCANADFFGLIDFKRSAGSIPDKKSVLNFDKVQLPFYLYNQEYSLDKSKYYVVGYFNMSEPTESMVFTNLGELASELKAKQFKKIYEFENISQLLEEYSKFQSSLESSIREEELFKAIPKDTNSCMFCAMSQTCSKGGAHAT
jgi:hypothetical protein